MSSMVSFFMDFRVDSSYDKVPSYQILFISMCRSEILGILDIFWIIKYISFEFIFFIINLDAVSSLKFLILLILCFFHYIVNLN